MKRFEFTEETNERIYYYLQAISLFALFVLLGYFFALITFLPQMNEQMNELSQCNLTLEGDINMAHFGHPELDFINITKFTMAAPCSEMKGWYGD